MASVPRLVYLDANALIYAVENTASPVRHLLIRSVSAGLSFVTSELTISEVLVKPFQHQDWRLAGAFDALLSGRSPIDVRTITRAILRESASIRAAQGAKLADAIHAATALDAGCRTIVTNDLRFPKLPSMSYVLPDRAMTLLGGGGAMP